MDKNVDSLKRQFQFWASVMLLGGIIYFASICNVQSFGFQLLVPASLGMILLLSAGLRIDVLNRRHHLKSYRQIVMFFRKLS